MKSIETQGKTAEQAIEILREEAGKQFDHILVQTFIELVESGEIELCCNKPNDAFANAFISP